MVSKSRNWHHSYLIILLMIQLRFRITSLVKDKRYSWLRSWSIQYPRGHFVTICPLIYRHPDWRLRLVMGIVTLCCTWQSPAPIYAPKNWPWPWPGPWPELWPWLRHLTLTLKQGNSDVKPRFLAFDHWPTTLTYNPNLHTKYQGCRSNGSGVRALTDRRKDRSYQVHYLPASLSYTVDHQSHLLSAFLCLCK